MSSLRGYYDVIVVGGGAVGVFATLDLALRGVSVLLLERRSICSGTSGRSHGMLHSGARYATTDPQAARECISENMILSEMAPHCIRDVGGFFVSVKPEEEEYHSELTSACERAGIPVRDCDVQLFRQLEPKVSEKVRSAVFVPDKVVYAKDLAVSAILLAVARGASVLEGAEASGLKVEDGGVVGVWGSCGGDVFNFECRGVINAAGPWCGEVAAKAGIHVEVIPAAGVMGVTCVNLTRHILNRMRPPSDGDIIVPYTSGATISGTTAMLVEDPDNIQIREEDANVLLQECGEVVPALRRVGFSRLYASVRPLISPSEEQMSLREITRSFEVLDHSEQGVRGFITALGGKLTTSRLIAETAVEKICQQIGAPRGSYTDKIRLDMPSEEDLRELRERLKAGELSGELASTLKAVQDAIDAERYVGLILPLLLASRKGGQS
ncbi:MAG: FAD-dependent oxidoreductase [Nitrososphaerota archaeon]